MSRRFGELFKHWKILRGDMVMQLTGREKGLTGQVLKVIRSQNRVIVNGFNRVTKHTKKQQDKPGQKVYVEAPVHVSNVSLVELVPGTGVDGKEPQYMPVKAAFRFLEDGTRVRVSRGGNASGNIIERPTELKERRWPRPREDGPKDTPKELVMQETLPAALSSSA